MIRVRLYEDNYSLNDIIDDIEDELGFSFVHEEDNTGYFILGQKIKLFIDFNGNIKISLEMPDNSVDFTQGKSRAEALVSALESSIEIYDIIQRMTDNRIIGSEYRKETEEDAENENSWILSRHWKLSP